MKTNIGSVANNVQIGRGGSIISDSADESISVKSSKSADLVDFYAKNLHASRVSVDYADIKNFNLESIDFAKNIYPLTNMQMALNTELRFPWKITGSSGQENDFSLNNEYLTLYSGNNSNLYVIDISNLDPQQLAGILYYSDVEHGTSEEIISLPQFSFEDFKIFIENNLKVPCNITYTSTTLSFDFEKVTPFKLFGYGYESVSANNYLNCLESEPNGFGLMNSRYISNCILGYSNLPKLYSDSEIRFMDYSILKISDGRRRLSGEAQPPRYYLNSKIIFSKTNLGFSNYKLENLQNGSKYQVVWNEDIKAIELIDQTKFFFETKSDLLSSLPTDGSYLYARIQKLNYNYKFNTSTNQWEISHFCKFGNLEVDNSGNKSFYPEYPVNFNPMDLQEQLNNASVKKYVKTFTAENFSNNKLSIPASEHNLGLDCALVYARKKVVESSTGYKDTFVQFYIDTNGNVTIEAEPFEGKLVLQIV